MRLPLCIITALMLTSLTFGQTPAKPGSGLSDKLRPVPTPISLNTEQDIKDYLGSWTVADPAALALNLVPADHFPSFGKLNPQDAMKPSADNVYVIHIVQWNDTASGTDDPKIQFESSDWYAYRYTGKQFESIKVSGKKFAPIYSATNEILLSVSVIRMTPKRTTPAPTITYSAAVTEKTAPNVAALEALAGAILNIKPPDGKEKAPFAFILKFAYNFKVESFVVSPKPLHAPFDVAYTASATPDPPVADATPKTKAASSTESDCANLTKKSNCGFSRTVSVDSRQYWDVGVDIVFHGPRENKYALSSSNTVTQSHTIHSALLATLDLSPWAYKLPMDKYPYLQVGLPLSGAAFHMPYFGISQPLPFTKKWLPISAYGGIVFMKQTFPQTLKIGQTTNTAAFNADLKSDWPIKGVYGIEVPVSSIVSKIKSGVGGGKSAGSSK